MLKTEFKIEAVFLAGIAKEGLSESEVKPEGRKVEEQAPQLEKQRKKKPKVRRLTPKDILADPGSYLDSWNYLDTVDPERFVKGIEILVNHVEKTLNTPQHERGSTAF